MPKNFVLVLFFVITSLEYECVGDFQFNGDLVLWTSKQEFIAPILSLYDFKSNAIELQRFPKKFLASRHSMFSQNHQNS